MYLGPPVTTHPLTVHFGHQKSETRCESAAQNQRGPMPVSPPRRPSVRFTRFAQVSPIYTSGKTVSARHFACYWPSLICRAQRMAQLSLNGQRWSCVNCITSCFRNVLPPFDVLHVVFHISQCLESHGRGTPALNQKTAVYVGSWVLEMHKTHYLHFRFTGTLQHATTTRRERNTPNQLVLRSKHSLQKGKGNW